MLSKLYFQFERKSHILVDRANAIERKPGLTLWEKRYLSESLLSHTWQLWNKFVKDVLYHSCNGCKTRKGIVIPPRVGDNTWRRIGYEAKNQHYHPTRCIQYMRHEPTWGDKDKIIDFINRLNPSNTSQLVSAFGLPLRGHKDLQIVRNACSHKNMEVMDEVKQLYIYYLGTSSVSHPADMTWLQESHSRDTAIYVWIDDLRIMADQATI